MKLLKTKPWVVYMLIGISLLSLSMAVGEIFYYQVPIGCACIIVSLGLESTRN